METNSCIGDVMYCPYYILVIYFTNLKEGCLLYHNHNTYPFDCPFALFSKNLIWTMSVTPHSCSASSSCWSVVH